MTDIALKWIDGVADAATNPGDLVADEGLETAVILSLFCERRADDSDVLPEGETDRRGWVGDQFSPWSNDQIGSKLWMLWREPRTAATLERARTYAEQSLAWAIEDGVAASVTVATSFATIGELTGSPGESDYVMVLEPKITKPDGSTVAFRYEYAWQQQAEKY